VARSAAAGTGRDPRLQAVHALPPEPGAKYEGTALPSLATLAVPTGFLHSLNENGVRKMTARPPS
jgi:hypothetical protein